MQKIFHANVTLSEFWPYQIRGWLFAPSRGMRSPVTSGLASHAKPASRVHSVSMPVVLTPGGTAVNPLPEAFSHLRTPEWIRTTVPRKDLIYSQAHSTALPPALGVIARNRTEILQGHNLPCEPLHHDHRAQCRTRTNTFAL